MLNGRLYRAAFLPFGLALAIAAFSLTAGPPVLTSTLAPDAFDGASAFSELQRLAGEFPQRRPGESGDQALAERVADTIRGLGGTAGGGFSVQVSHLRANTIDGERTLTTVIAQRAGSTGETPIVILAHRDAAARGSQAELSATAALLELARVFATSETKRTIILVSTSGGSAGDAGAAGFAANAHGPFDAAIVLGDLAGVRASKPSVVPYSDGFGSAPLQLQRTVAAAITREAASAPGAPSVLGQLSHLAFPLTPGEQGPLDEQGIPAVLVQVSGERGPAAREAVSAQRLEGYGRGVLSAVYALDGAPDVSSAMQTGVLVQRQTIPAWAWRLLVGTLLLGPLAVTVDWLARLNRRREPIARWTLWTLACAVPFLLAAVFARLLGLLGALPSAPAAPAMSSALPFDGLAARAVAATLLVLALAWALWPPAMRRLGLAGSPQLGGRRAVAAARARRAVRGRLGAESLYRAAADRRPSPVAADRLSPAAPATGASRSRSSRSPWPRSRCWPPSMRTSSVWDPAAWHGRRCGCSPAVTCRSRPPRCGASALDVPCPRLCLPSHRLRCEPGPRTGERAGITIRGPRSYAGPGSLGGTESALRR